MRPEVRGIVGVVVALCALVVPAACRSPPAPLGEALLVVDTDVAVPARVNRLRVDVLSASGALLSTREIPAPSRVEWPVSFSVVGGDEDVRAALVRLRAYPEGHLASARELAEQADASAPAPLAATSLEEACREPPELRLEQPLTLRRGSTPITSVLPYTTREGAVVCSQPTRAGAAVARLVVTEADVYVVEILRSVPDGARGAIGGDATVSLRRDCLFPTAQIACADDLGAVDGRPRLSVALSPGTYYVVTGGAEPASADLTLLASRPSTVQSVPAAPPAQGPRSTEREPAPGVTIDRLVALELAGGERGTAEIILRGECLGTPADLDGRATCTDTASARSPVVPEVLSPGLRRTTGPFAPWSGEATVPCAAPPRGPSDLLDEEVCVPGGAFALGDTLALNDLDERSQPERVRVVEPFLLDRFEVTVGRYRDALRRGFQSVARATPEPGALRPGHMCTWSEGATPDVPAPGIDRERLPLTCVSWAEARAFCRFAGGDLPTEDQWEYAATAAGKPSETPYPWGTELPACSRTVFERATAPIDRCAPAFGPVAVDDPALVEGDRAPFGAVALAGNVQEWQRDAFVPYAARPWQAAGLRAPLDFAEDAPLRSTRGADWAGPMLFATGSARRAEPPLSRYDNLGFRCARPGR